MPARRRMPPARRPVEENKGDAAGKYHTTTSRGGASASGGAVWGGFWGMLFGLLFFIPFAGFAIGAGFGALFGHLGKNAIDQSFQQQVRDYLQPGTSALFMIIRESDSG